MLRLALMVACCEPVSFIVCANLCLCRPDRGVSNLSYMARHGYSEEMLDCLLNLDLSLSCDGFVASFYSNWSRLIEELRATVRCKAHRVFLDVDAQLMHRQGGLDLNW